MHVHTALVVEDEPAMLELISVQLRDAGYAVQPAADAETAAALVRELRPEVVLLDWMLPGQSGLAFAMRLRSDPNTCKLPIIMVRAETDEADKIAGFEALVDDFVTKPFSPSELKARIKAVMRRHAPDIARQTLIAGNLRLDPVAQRVTVADAEAELRPTEFRLLRFFLGNPERVLSRAQIRHYVWPDRTHVDARTVDVHVGRLRRALQPHGYDSIIETVYGSGYRLGVPGGR